MSRDLTIAAAQLGPIARGDSRAMVVRRLLDLLRQAKSRGCNLVVFPEMALTTFFPRWHITEQAEVDAYFEREMPGRDTAPLFDEARRLGIGFCLGYAELVSERGRLHRYNTAIFVDPDGRIAGKYRKVHLPGHAEPQPGRKFQHLEKRYFEVGNLGFPVFPAMDVLMGMLICNDRRWPEAYRVLGLQGAELIMLGYNTPIEHTLFPDIDGLSHFHNHLSMQAGAYQNSAWVVGVAKAGVEEGSSMIGQSAIIAPSGEIVAMAVSRDDELISARCDLALGERYRRTIFNLAAHRRPEHYRLIVERTGPGAPLPIPAGALAPAMAEPEGAA